MPFSILAICHKSIESSQWMVLLTWSDALSLKMNSTDAGTEARVPRPHDSNTLPHEIYMRCYKQINSLNKMSSYLMQGRCLMVEMYVQTQWFMKTESRVLEVRCWIGFSGSSTARPFYFNSGWKSRLSTEAMNSKGPLEHCTNALDLYKYYLWCLFRQHWREAAQWWSKRDDKHDNRCFSQETSMMLPQSITEYCMIHRCLFKAKCVHSS